MHPFVEIVRQFIRDYPKMNELRGVHESSDQQIWLCIMLAIDDFNTTPPLIPGADGPDTFPAPGLLLLGTITYLLQSAGILQFRNSLSYQDGGVNVGVWDKGPAYVGNAQMFGQMWEQKKVNYKRALNVRRGWGMIQSADFNMYNFARFFAGDYFAPGDAARAIATNFQMGDASYRGTLVTAHDPSQDKRKTEVTPFTLDMWTPDPLDASVYQLPFVHNLLYKNVMTILDDPTTGEDLSGRIRVFKTNERMVVLKVKQNPDGRLAGTIQCIVP